MDSFGELEAGRPHRIIVAPEGRRIEIGGEAIRICRRIAGLDTWVNVPLRSYRGVTLRVAATGQCEIALLHVDPALDLVLARAPDDRDVIAVWRGYGRMIDLPLLVEDAAGRLQPITDRPAAVGARRRAGSALRNRRPRFLARRVVGRTMVGEAGVGLTA
jgi:hypothetical protein